MKNIQIITKNTLLFWMLEFYSNIVIIFGQILHLHLALLEFY